MGETNNFNPTLDELEIYRLCVCCGMPQREVAIRFGVSQPEICRRVRSVGEYFRYAKREEVGILRSSLTARLEWIYGEAMRAWERSQKPEVVKTTKDSAKEGVFETIRETPQSGMPTFLKIGMDACDGIVNLWAAEMAANDRQGESRVVGKTQAQRIDQKIEELQRAKAKLADRQNGGGAGDRA